MVVHAAARTALSAQRAILPQLSFHTVTPAFVWRHALALQAHLVRERPSGELGHYYEFGVYRGKSLVDFARVRDLLAAFRPAFAKVSITGFDSFEGLPASDDVGDRINSSFVEGAYAVSVEAVAAHLRAKRVRGAQLVRGMYEVSLTSELKTRLTSFRPSMIRVDCDYMTSTTTVLDWLDGFLLPGSILYFDDVWAAYGDPGTGEFGAIARFNDRPDRLGTLVEHPIGMGSRMVYMYAPRIG